MKNYSLIQHSRGNHTPQQVYNHGKLIFEGTKKECQQELVRMRKFCRHKWHNTSTSDKQRDFVAYEMADIFFIKKIDNQISWA